MPEFDYAKWLAGAKVEPGDLVACTDGAVVPVAERDVLVERTIGFDFSATISWVRGCCDTPIDQPHADDCPMAVKARQDQDPWCIRGDQLKAGQPVEETKPETPGEALARAMGRSR